MRDGKRVWPIGKQYTRQETSLTNQEEERGTENESGQSGRRMGGRKRGRPISEGELVRLPQFSRRQVRLRYQVVVENISLPMPASPPIN